jgi:hypothetical protein
MEEARQRAVQAAQKAYHDRNLRVNNCTNMNWWGRELFMAWAEVRAPDIFKKRGPQPQHNGRVTTPAPKPAKPTTTGWDDFDWSR